MIQQRGKASVHPRVVLFLDLYSNCLFKKSNVSSVLLNLQQKNISSMRGTQLQSRKLVKVLKHFGLNRFDWPCLFVMKLPKHLLQNCALEQNKALEMFCASFSVKVYLIKTRVVSFSCCIGSVHPSLHKQTNPALFCLSVIMSLSLRNHSKWGIPHAHCSFFFWLWVKLNRMLSAQTTVMI